MYIVFLLSVLNICNLGNIGYKLSIYNLDESIITCVCGHKGREIF